MSKNNAFEFDLDAQLEQIENFTRQQQQEVQSIITRSHRQLSTVESDQAVQKVEQEVSGLLNSLETQLEKEMTKINQQLQTLLPTEEDQR